MLAAALRAMGEGVCVVERKMRKEGLRIVFANEAFAAMTGYDREELIGRGHALVQVDREDRARLTRWLHAAHPSRPLNGESALVRRDGTTIFTAWTFSPLSGANQQVTHLVVTYRDMTEKRGLQEMAGHTQRLEAVGRLAGGVAHDFNNLISVINGYCEMLTAQLSDLPEPLHKVKEIHKAGRKAAALTTQLLTFGRRQPMDARVINLNHLIQDNAEIINRLIGDAGRLELELDASLGNVRVDPTQFQQVLLNLTLNARDALRDDGLITIGTRRREIKASVSRRRTDIPAGRYIVLSISDNGTGMDADTQKHLFEPFFTTKPEGKGTGLGLALVYGVVQQCGGYITAHSELLVGTTFEIVLPELCESVTPAAPGGGSTPPMPAAKGHETIVLLETDVLLRKMIAGMLTAEGYRVIEAGNTGEVLSRTRDASQPLHLFIGCLVGEVSKLGRTLHKTHPDLRVVNVCNQGVQPSCDWLSADHQASLPKPFALSELISLSRRLLDA